MKCTGSWKWTFVLLCTLWGSGCYVLACDICVYCWGRGTANSRYISCWWLRADSCVYHPLPILFSYVELLFCWLLGLKLLFTATCLTIDGYSVVLYGSVTVAFCCWCSFRCCCKFSVTSLWVGNGLDAVGSSSGSLFIPIGKLCINLWFVEHHLLVLDNGL